MIKNDIGKWSKIGPEMGQNWSTKVKKHTVY